MAGEDVAHASRPCMRSLAICVTSEPADHLLMKLQRLDAQGGAIYNVVHPTKSALVACMNDIVSSLLSPRDGPFRMLLDHFRARSFDAAVVCMEVLTRCALGFAGRIWRLYCIWNWFPYLLVRLVDPEVTQFEKETIANLLFSVE